MTLAHLRSGALALVVAAVTLPPTTLVSKAAGLAGAERVERVNVLLAQANAERNKVGLAPLRPNTQLMTAAQMQAEQSASIGRLAHVLPDAKYPTPEDRLEASGYPWRAYAENIAMGQPSPTHAVEAWMNSAGHRKNLLNPTYTELGTGFAVDGTGRPYYVQVFGKPRG
jgi:uncharacterized protein YkwD